MRRGDWPTALLVGTLLGAGCPAEPSARQAPPPLPPTGSDTRDDPLRMPPELHLRHVRQLSFGGRAFNPKFSRDGKRLAFLSVPAAKGAPDAGTSAPVPHLIDLGSGGGTELLPATAATTTSGAGGALIDLWFAPAGELCGDFSTAPCGPAASQCRVDATRALGPGRCAPPQWKLSRAGPCSATAAGDWACLFIADSGSQLFLWPAGAASPYPIDSRPGLDADPDFSPGGKVLAWSTTRGEVGNPAASRPVSGIQVLPASQFARPMPLPPVSPPGQANQHPALFPNGDHLLFASNADDAAGRDMDLFRVGADGQGLERITFAPGADVDPAVSPDGHWVAWVSERNAAAPGEQDVMIAEWVE